MHATFDMELKFVDQRDRKCGPEDYPLPRWLAELREMRGRVFYDNGRRPYFRMGDGSFVDPDPVDTEAFHIIARSQGRAVGCARIVPPSNLQSGFIASTIGTRRFEAILRDLGSDPERSCEASRWVVVPECRGRLGRQIVAGSWAIARWLSLETAFVLACTCERQDLALIGMGARANQWATSLPFKNFRGQFSTLVLRHVDASKPMEKQMAQITRAIRLNQIIASSRPVGPNAAAYVVI